MEQWQKDQYLMTALLPRFKHRLEEAQNALKQAIETCQNPAVSFSFGKDSLVCMDIARQIKPDILIINIDRGQGGDLEEAVKMYEDYAREYGLNYHRVKTPKEILEIYREAGSILNVNRNRLKKNLMAGIKTAREKFNIDCEITGLRAEESMGRSYLRRHSAFHYSQADREWKCKPVLNWTGEDIWAYIISKDLPYLRWYDLEAAFVGYERARYSNWAGIFQAERGRFVRLRKNYPKEYKELVSIFPEIRSYV